MWSSSTSLCINPEICRELLAFKENFEMADRRDWGGGGDDPKESTQRMIERIWESLTDIRARMDQQAPVPPVAVPPGDGETVPITPVPPGVEVPFVSPVPPPPPVLLAEEPVIQVENALVIGGTDTSSRHCSPASSFPVPHSSEPRPGSLEVPGMGLRPCGPQRVLITLARLHRTPLVPHHYL
ncbi:hypothetical protein Taro_004826 [Colocasia esculenta]|uniref:Uncharacterized protein n=1 Tax=Colocasia esculenta TaxID=4460 RepID=A0A843TL88_COLES|nr:hypothetical protein [Colocasia esculenta]